MKHCPSTSFFCKSKTVVEYKFQNYSFFRDLGDYLVVLKQKLTEFFRNRKGKLVFERELLF